MTTQQGREDQMHYESHVTVDNPTGTEEATWLALCGELGIKPLRIALAKGDHPIQLMCAAPFEGDEESAILDAERIVDFAHRDGLEVVRVKVEMPLDKAMEFPPSNVDYYECHMKLILQEDEGDPAQISQSLGQVAHLHASRNTLAHTDGLQKHYLTDRSYHRSATQAARRFAAAYENTRIISYKPMRMEMEAVILDSNPGLDAGWAQP